MQLLDEFLGVRPEPVVCGGGAERDDDLRQEMFRLAVRGRAEVLHEDGDGLAVDAGRRGERNVPVAWNLHGDGFVGSDCAI